MTQFHVGQKVVCIRAGWSKLPHYHRFLRVGGGFPKKGEIYTIRSVAIADGEAGCWLSEINNPEVQTKYGLKEPGFLQSSFRPVVERKTSIEIFKAMLNNEPQKVSA